MEQNPAGKGESCVVWMGCLHLRLLAFCAGFAASGLAAAPPVLAQEISGFIGAKSLSYFESGPGNRHIGTLSFGLDSGYSLTDELALTLRLYGVGKPGDGASSYIDPAIAKVSYSTGSLQFDLGYDIVFWGVVESQRIVDVINQRDQLRSLRGDRVLGQPMATVKYFGDTYSVSAFILPRFVPLNWGSDDYRLGLPFPVDDSRTTYESPRGRSHVDYAARLEGYIGNLQLGFSVFDGTLRQPELRLDPAGPVLVPHYRLGRQYGLDLLYNAGAALLKFEGRHVNPRSDTSFESAVFGVEYPFGPVFGTPYQLSVLAEHNLDSRGKTSPVRFQNDFFLGWRLDFSNTAGTNLFVGSYYDFDYHSMLHRVTLETRLSDRILLNIEGYLTHARDRRDALYNARQIDQLSVSLQWNF